MKQGPPTGARPQRGTAALEQPLRWADLPEVQTEHDARFHDDVMAASPEYQIRHCLMHLDKILGALASIAEKSFHHEELHAEIDRFKKQRLPDLLVFALKLQGLSSAAWPPAPKMTNIGTPDDPDWLERQLASLEGVIHAMTSHRRAFMQNDPPAEARLAIDASIKPLVQVAVDLAAGYDIDLLESYRLRIRDVEHRKLA